MVYLNLRDSKGRNFQAQVPPASGKVYVEPRILSQLDAKIGDKIQLGTSLLEVEASLVTDPVPNGNFMQMAPLVIMNHSDLDRTGLLGQGSRASHQQMFMGDEAAVAQLLGFVRTHLKLAERIQSVKDGPAAMESAFERASRFLRLASLLSIVLAGAAITLSASSLMRKESMHVAVVRTMGGKWRPILLDYLSNIYLIAVVAGFAGVVFGYVLQDVLVMWLGDLLPIALPSPSGMPVLSGLLTALLMVTGFLLPYLLRLLATPAAQVFQSRLLVHSTSTWSLLVFVVPAFFLLLWMQAETIALAAWVFASVVVALMVFWLLSGFLLKALMQMTVLLPNPVVSALRTLRRSHLLLVVFSVAFFAMLLLTSLRVDLIDRWQSLIPKKAPNHFLINIQTHQTEALQDWFESHGMSSQLYPMFRGRLIKINDQLVTGEDYESESSKRLLNREFNLSSFQQLQSSNRVVQGQWFSKGQSTGYSIEEGVADDLGIQLGDRLTFNIAGKVIQDVVISVRKVQWESMQPNFFVVGAPGVFPKESQSFLTSFYLDPAVRDELIGDLIAKFSNLSVIDASAVIKQVNLVLDQAVAAIQAVFLFSVLSSLLVLYAALQSQRAERRVELAILKALGAGQSGLRARILWEFTLLGGLAGFLASIMASLISNLMGLYLFDLSLRLNPTLIVGAVILGALLAGAAAWLSLRRLLKQTPVSLFS